MQCFMNVFFLNRPIFFVPTGSGQAVAPDRYKFRHVCQLPNDTLALPPISNARSLYAYLLFMSFIKCFNLGQRSHRDKIKCLVLFYYLAFCHYLVLQVIVIKRRHQQFIVIFNNYSIFNARNVIIQITRHRFCQLANQFNVNRFGARLL